LRRRKSRSSSGCCGQERKHEMPSSCAKPTESEAGGSEIDSILSSGFRSVFVPAGWLRLILRRRGCATFRCCACEAGRRQFVGSNRSKIQAESQHRPELPHVGQLLLTTQEFCSLLRLSCSPPWHRAPPLIPSFSVIGRWCYS